MNAKRILVTTADREFNQTIARHLLSRGHRVALQVPSLAIAESLPSRFDPDQRARMSVLVQHAHTAESVKADVDHLVRAMGGIDALVHGHEQIDEMAELGRDGRRFGELLGELFRRIFVTTRAVVPHMVGRREGAIVFPVVYDCLHYAGYPTSPTLDHGKISMMKCLARELTPFSVRVNALSFGYYDPGFSPAEKKETRQIVSIYGLKPPLPSLAELVPALDLLLSPPTPNLGGQNIHIGMGIETTL